MLDNHPRTQLCFIINQYGRIIIDDPRRCRGLLKDLAPNHKRETNVLFLALEEKIVAELAKTNTQIPLAILIERLAHRLHDSVGIQKEFALWAVESWAIALDVIQQPLPKQTNEIVLEDIAIKEAKSAVYKLCDVLRQVATKRAKSAVYKLGDVLPDGGIVFHVHSSGRHGLAARSVDEEGLVFWKDALRLARKHGQGWHMPTKDELNLLYQQKSVVGGFANDLYWSSTEAADSNLAWYQSFNSGNQNLLTKYYSFPVRAVRAF